ncbi:unnamed protein product [Linum trigynum]
MNLSVGIILEDDREVDRSSDADSLSVLPGLEKPCNPMGNYNSTLEDLETDLVALVFPQPPLFVPASELIFLGPGNW